MINKDNHTTLITPGPVDCVGSSHPGLRAPRSRRLAWLARRSLRSCDPHEHELIPPLLVRASDQARADGLTSKE